MHRNGEVLDIDDLVDTFPNDDELVDSDTGGLYDSTPEPEEESEEVPKNALSEVTETVPQNPIGDLAAGASGEATRDAELLDAMLQQASNNGLT